MKDRVIGTEDGYDCIVAGRRYGTWRSRAEAHAGMAVEQRRARTERGWNIRITYTAPGAGMVCNFDCIDAARTFAHKRVGERPEIGPHHAVGGGGMILVTGCSLDMLFPHADEPTTFRRMT